MFVSDCIAAQTGLKPLSDMLGQYTCPTTAMAFAKKKIKQFDYPKAITIVQALDQRLNRISTQYPPRGSITAKKVEQAESVTGYILGVVLRRQSAFVSEGGMVFIERSAKDIFWSVE
tara:strand:+ start:272 stop:622 length:351 start_codon:yes stop_codon:yes gene_type:complete